MSKSLSYYLYHLLFIIPVFTFSGITLEDIESFEKISCKIDKDCPDNLSCRNNFCQYHNFYCLGNDTCIEENISNNIFYSYHSETQDKEGIFSSIFSFMGKKKDTLIIEACHPSHKDCKTRPCSEDSDCFTGVCDKKTKRCLINKNIPFNACISNEKEGGMTCGKYIEEECLKNDECLTRQCDTRLYICNNFEKNNTTTINNNINNNNNNTNNNNNINNNNNNNTISNIENDDTVTSLTYLKEGSIIAFVIIPVVVFTQYLKTTKTVKNIKNNRQAFEYKTVFVDDLSNC
jgi:hypothetical protein